MPTLSLTRQSSLLAILLLVAIVIVTMVRTIAFGGDTLTIGGGAATALLLIATGIVTNRLAVSIGIFNDYCTLPLSLYAIASCSINPETNLVQGGVVALMMAIALHLFVKTLQHPNTKEMPLFGGILLGAMPLIYAPAIALAPLMMVWAWVVPLKPRQAIASLAGYLLPVAATSYVVWYAGYPLSTVVFAVVDSLVASGNAFAVERLDAVAVAGAAMVVAMAVAGAVLLYARRSALLVRSRKGAVMTFVTLVAVVAMVAIPSADMTLGTMTAIPASVLVAALLNHCRRSVADLLYLALIVLFLVSLA